MRFSDRQATSQTPKREPFPKQAYRKRTRKIQQLLISYTTKRHCCPFFSELISGGCPAQLLDESCVQSHRHPLAQKTGTACCSTTHDCYMKMRGTRTRQIQAQQTSPHLRNSAKGLRCPPSGAR